MSSGVLDALKAKFANVQAQLEATKKQAEEYISWGKETRKNRKKIIFIF